MNSLDPRINRFPPIEGPEKSDQGPLDQLQTFEIFLKTKEGRPFTHVGVIHASNEEFAFLFAKEQFSRRLTCRGLWVVKTQNILVGTKQETDAGNKEPVPHPDHRGTEAEYFIFELAKRGKQAAHTGTISAVNSEDAYQKWQKDNEEAFSIWVVRSDDIYKSSEEDMDIWATLPEKKYREAIDYKGQSKIDDFKNS